ncbi:MAG: pyridoxal phosphate-dependent aminotransferase [Candidatus Omnitrophica bacterium]|nr:pyridoxal phosphate-dependent aminotransferase [Candidatus Omnitrophota bacterium]MDD5611120.1 pyridoxal phosphate-dependent aminotransferase [Candidatus Omnitrophota bacterium]
MIKFASRIEKVKPSPTLALTAKAKKLKAEGKDIVNFGAGEPDFDTPDFIKDKAIEAIRSGFTKYTPTQGTLELREAISEKFKKDNSLQYAPDQIVVSSGAKHSIYNIISVLVDLGDEVLIPSPYWVSYPEMVNLAQGKPVFMETQAANNFKITAEQLKKNISKKTKLLILNSPSNPTGCVYTEQELKDIARVCVENNIFVISDEIYEKLIYDGTAHFSIASIDSKIYDLTITVNGVSKSYSMTGWRIGYLGAPKEITQAVSRLQDHSTSCPASISQKAAVFALKEGGEFVNKMRDEFRKRRDYIIKRLDNMSKIDYIRPQGAFYVFCCIKYTGLTSSEFSSRLLDEAGVSLIPGQGFGRDDYIRISFATNMKEIEKGMDRLQKWLEELR